MKLHSSQTSVEKQKIWKNKQALAKDKAADGGRL